MYVYISFAFLLDPTLMVQLVPPVVNGNDTVTPINLTCTATVAQNIMSAAYAFVWMKDGNAISQSNRISV